jgi:hypothetical protein
MSGTKLYQKTKVLRAVNPEMRDIEPNFLTIESIIHDQGAVVFDTRVSWKIICLNVWWNIRK